jgi:hypothetical protein
VKWSEFEAQNPRDLYKKLRQVCEDYHSEVMRKGGFTSRFCNHCYEREGWKCFPCNNMAEIYEERYDEAFPGKEKDKKKKR